MVRDTGLAGERTRLARHRTALAALVMAAIVLRFCADDLGWFVVIVVAGALIMSGSLGWMSQRDRDPGRAPATYFLAIACLASVSGAVFLFRGGI